MVTQRETALIPTSMVECSAWWVSRRRGCYSTPALRPLLPPPVRLSRRDMP
jgi:hypothetical protein